MSLSREGESALQRLAKWAAGQETHEAGMKIAYMISLAAEVGRSGTRIEKMRARRLIKKVSEGEGTTLESIDQLIDGLKEILGEE